MGNLLLVRHGQASAFEENYDRLSTLGERQARLLGEHLARAGVRIDRVFAGPRVRQQRSAEIAAEAGGLPAPVIVPEFDEMQVEPLFREHMPELFEKHEHLRAIGDALLAADGDESRARIFARLFEGVLHLWLRGQVGAEGVETWLDFQTRLRRAVSLATSDAKRKRVLVFTSAGPVAAALQQATGCDDLTALNIAFRVRNTSYSEFLFSDERFSLVSFNESPHLTSDLVTLR